MDADIPKRILDTIKRNGDFDLCRKEIFEKLVESQQMQECMVECQKMVREVVDAATSSAENDISIETLRKRVQDKIRQSSAKTKDPLYKQCNQHMRDYDRKFSEIIEKVIQSEGLQQASNNDSIDMEVSSGASSPSSESSSDTSTSNSRSSSSQPSESPEKYVADEDEGPEVEQEVHDIPLPPSPPLYNNSSHLY